MASQSSAGMRDLLTALLPGVLCKTSDASRLTLVGHAQLRPFDRHGEIAAQGYEPWLVLVVRGHIGVVRSDPGGKRRMIRIAHRGDLISTMALCHTPAAAEDLMGLDDGLAALWPGDLATSLAESDAGLSADLLEHTLSGMARVLDQLDRQSFDSVSSRLARILWQEQGLLFGTRPLLSRPELADLAGATREMVDRVLRDLEAQSIVARVGRSGLTLLDPDRLRALAEVDGDFDPRDMEPCRRMPLDEDALPHTRN